MAEKGSVNKDDRFYKGVISRSHNRLLEDLDPVALLDEFIVAEYLTSVQIRDIQDMQKQSDKIREILIHVRSKGVQGYKKFKQMLTKSKQKHLAEYLSELEDDLEKEISYQSIFESVNHGRTVQAQARTQTENSGKFGTIDSQMPDTDGNIQQMPDEREVTNDMQQLSLDQPSIYGGNSNGYSKASQQEMKVVSQHNVNHNEPRRDVPGMDQLDVVLLQDTQEAVIPQHNVNHNVPRRDVPGMDQLDAVQLQDTQEAAVPQHNVNFIPPESINSQDGISARNDRLEKIFKSEHDIKGRLKILTAQNIEDLLDSCDSQHKYSGGFGDIYVSKGKIPGLNRKIVVKKVDLNKEEAELKMTTLTSEKLCARSVHFAIVPLYGIREDSENRIFYFLSPYMENGSLNQVIEDDNKRLDRPVLHPGLRVRILFQIASAIDFLHTPLKDIRGIIIHGDIKSLNIVLDEAYNARLIDFGLAREMKEGHDHTKTTSRYVFTPGYGKMTQQDILAKHDDYRYFGVVIRELLTGTKPSVEDLINQVPRRIERRLLGMWKKLEIKPPVGQSLVELSTKCIKDKTVSSKEIVMTLKEVLKKTNTPRWGNLNEADNLSKKCDMCLENDSVGERILTHYNCQNNMNICVSCMRNSYCNPIHCHSCEKEADSIDTTIYPTIGHGWVALLIAGDDSRDCVAKSFKADVDEVFKVITSKCPLVMGVSVENVQIVNPVEGVKEKMKDVVKALQKVDDIQTLLVYISSHYVPEKGGFELKSKPKKEFLSILELQEIIANILQGKNQRTIVLLDCCSSPAITIAQIPVQDGKNIPTDKEPQAEVDDTNTSETSNKTVQELIGKVQGIRIVQLNACRSDQKAIVEQGGSLFRKILLQSLTRNALDEPCVNSPKCESCSLPGDFVTVGNMQDYIAEHCDTKCDCVSYNHNVDDIDVKIGYVINFKVDLQVTYRYGDKVEHDRIPQRMFGELSELQIVLFEKYVEKMGLDMPADGETADGEPRLSTTDFYDILCIEVEKGPKEHQRDRLNTLERVMAAWNAKRELVVTLRTLLEVIDGAVGIFLPSDQSVKPILDILQKDRSIRCVEEDHAKKYVIKLDDELNDFKSFLGEVEKQKTEQQSPSIETFDAHSIDLEEALNKLDESEKKLLKELQIVFPCTNVDGTRNVRRNFLCYQVVRREDG